MAQPKPKNKTPQQIQQKQEEKADLTPKGRFSIFTPIRISSEYDDKTYVEYMMNSHIKVQNQQSLENSNRLL